MIKISAVVTCFNNEKTIAQCLQSLTFADEIVVLDSFSDDKTLDILNQYNCEVHQKVFESYHEQKQSAIDLASHQWVILLDSDEYLTTNAIEQIQQWQKSQPQADAYEMPRREWVFWQWSHNWVHKNGFIRLFRKDRAQVSQELVHESIKSIGVVSRIDAVIHHKGETSISLKIDKINHYSNLAAQQKYTKGIRVIPIKLLLYPVWYFFKQYFLRRQILNGWAGFINASLNSRYAFLKYAKLYELQKNKN